MSEAQSSIFENNEFDNLKVFFQVLKENILPDEISKDQKWWEQDAKSKKFKIGLIRTKELDTQINIFGELYDMSKKKMKNTKTNINTSKTSKNNYFNSEENVEITEMNYETEIIKTLSEFDEEYLGWMNNQKIEEEEKKVRKNAMRQLFRFIFGSKKIVDVNEFHKKLAKAYIKLDPIHKIPCGDDPSKKLHDDFKQSLLKRRDKAVKDGQNILAVYGEKHILSDKMKTLLMGLRDMIDELDNPNSSCIVYGRDKGLEDEYERNQKLKIDLTKDENYIRLLSVFRDFVKDRKEAKLYTQTTLRSKFRNSTIKPDKDADELFNELIDFLDSLTDEEEVDELYEIILYLSFLLQVAVKLHEIQIVLDEIKCRLKGGEEEDEDDTGDLKAQVEDLKKKVSESKNILTENDGDSDEIKELKKTLKTFVDVIESGDNDKIKEVLEELSKLPELKRIQSELEGVKKALGEKEAALGKKEAELKNLNEKLNNITTTNESVDTLKQTLEQIKKDNQIEIDKLKQQIGQGLTEEKKDELEKKIKELTDDNTKLDSSIDAIKTELQQANEAKDTAVADLSGAIAAAKLAKEERNQGIAAAQKERNDAFVDLSGAKAAAEEAKKQKNSVEAEVARLTAELATKTATEEEKNRIEGELINAKNQLQQKTTELENAEKALTTAQQERNTAFEDLSGARQEVQKVTQERNTAIASADAAKAAAEQRVRDATEAKEQAEREKAAAIDLATASQQEIQRLTTELQQKGNIESEKTALTNQLNEEKNKLADANLAIDAANKRATEADSKMALAQAAATAAQEAAADAQAEAAKQVDAEKQAASAAIKAAEEGAKKAIKEANDAANIAIQAAKEQVEKMKEDISDLTTQLDEAEEIRKEAVKELVKEIEKAQEYKAATVIQTSALRQMIDIKKDRIKELEEQIRKLQEASAGSGSGSGPGPGPEDGDGGSVAGSENDDGNSEDGDGDSVIKQENIVLNTPDEHTIVKGLYHDFIKIVTPLLGENSKYLYYNTGKKYPYSTNNISHIYNYMKNENKINDDVTLLNDYKELILKKFKELLENTNAVIYKKIKQNLFNIIKGVEITNNYSNKKIIINNTQISPFKTETGLTTDEYKKLINYSPSIQSTTQAKKPYRLGSSSRSGSSRRVLTSIPTEKIRSTVQTDSFTRVPIRYDDSTTQYLTNPRFTPSTSGHVQAAQRGIVSGLVSRFSGQKQGGGGAIKPAISKQSYCETMLTLLLLFIKQRGADPQTFLDKAGATLDDLGQCPLVLHTLNQLVDLALEQKIPEKGISFKSVPMSESLEHETRVLMNSLNSRFEPEELEVLNIFTPRHSVLRLTPPEDFKEILGQNPYFLNRKNSDEEKENEETLLHGLEEEYDSEAIVLTKEERKELEKEDGIPLGTLLFLYLNCLREFHNLGEEPTVDSKCPLPKRTKEKAKTPKKSKK